MKMTPLVGSLRAGEVTQVMLDYVSQFRKLKPTTLKDLADKQLKQQSKEQSPTKTTELPPVEPPKKEGKKESK